MTETAITEDDARWRAIQSKVQESRIVSAFEIFRQNGVEPVLLKGWAIGRLYPEDLRRRVGDIDLAVSEADFPAASEILRSEEAIPLHIDLHRELRDLDTLPWEKIVEQSELVEIDGEQIRILGEEDHLRVLAVHWLLDGGRYKDKLWDIYYAVHKQSADFDWARCIDVVEENRRRWVICAIGLAHHFLNLRISDLQFADEAKNIPRWILRAVEREWRQSEDLQPILAVSYDPRWMFRQILRRLPPNPIRATIEADGDLYDNSRLIYQIRVLRRRTRPFFKGVAEQLRRKFLRPHS
jgi:hypothetical protein